MGSGEGEGRNVASWRFVIDTQGLDELGDAHDDTPSAVLYGGLELGPNRFLGQVELVGDLHSLTETSDIGVYIIIRITRGYACLYHVFESNSHST